MSISSPDVRTVDDKCRMTLPKQFAGAKVIVEVVSDTEVRIRKAAVVPVDDIPFLEQTLQPLSDRDRDRFLNLLENPPKPNAALRKAMARYRKRHG